MAQCIITYTFQCYACKKKEEITAQWFDGQDIAVPTIPEGWTSAEEEYIFCPDHEVFLIVDSEKRYPMNEKAHNKPIHSGEESS